MYYPGAILLWVAAAFGLLSTVAYAAAARRGGDWLKTARQAYVAMTVAVVLASGLLTYLILTHDYRVYYVYAYSDNALPLHYLLSTFWAGQEGSFLLWVLAGVLIGLPLMRAATEGWEERVMGFYNLTLLALLALMLKQSPFRFHQGLTADMIPVDGQGLNPLLQNPWMVIHPPVMFVGYAALAVPFAFAMAALVLRRYDEWTRVARPWVLFGLGSLGAAIMLGGYWAYETLGWGGYWGWDPVENASFVPWLACAALAHGMLLERVRKRFRRVNLVLAAAAFLLVLYATFLTRSGVLSDFSVHSFVDLGLSGYLIFVMGFFLVLSIGLLIWRWRGIPTEVGKEAFLSRTVFMALAIVLLVLIGLIVGLGTSSPIISRLWGEPSTVTASFYNRTGFWLAIAFALTLGVSPFLAWSRAGERFGRKLAVSALVSAALVAGGALILAPVLGWNRALEGVEVQLAPLRAILYCTVALFAVVANSWSVAEALRGGRWRSSGAAVSHVGLGLMLLAFLTTGWLGRNQSVTLAQGTSTAVLGYEMKFRGVERPTPAARDAMVVDVSTPEGRTFELRPKMWVNEKTRQLVANPDIRMSLGQDLYVAPSSYEPGREAPPSARLALTKGKAEAFRDWTLRFDRFEIGAHGEMTGAMSVGVVVLVERPGVDPVELMPTMVIDPAGQRRLVPADIPGLPGAALRTVGVDADRGMAWVEVVGAGGGVARTAILHKGERMAFRDYGITFSGFDLEGFSPDAGKIDFGVVFTVEKSGERFDVVPRFASGPEGTLVSPAEVPGSGGLTLTLGRIDAEGGAVELQVLDPEAAAPATEPAKLVLDISTKPLIGLIWLGTILVVFGVTLAMANRSRTPMVQVAEE